MCKRFCDWAFEAGLSADHLLLFELQPPQTHYRGRQIFPYTGSRAEAGRDPWHSLSGTDEWSLISGNAMVHTFIPEGQQRKPEGNRALSPMMLARVFLYLGIPIVAGRGFNSSDTETSRKVAVVNESLARKYFPGLNPIGRTSKPVCTIQSASRSSACAVMRSTITCARIRNPPTTLPTGRNQRHRAADVCAGHQS